MSRIIICGNRNFNDYELFSRNLDIILFDRPDTEIVSGGARGADNLAQRYAQEHGYKFTELKANWEKYKRHAGVMRNSEMLAYALEEESPLVIAFWDGKSKGTADTITKARAKNVEVQIVNIVTDAPQEDTTAGGK